MVYSNCHFSSPSVCLLGKSCSLGPACAVLLYAILVICTLFPDQCQGQDVKFDCIGS